jgi:CRISPR-associated protein Cas1
MVEIVGPTFIGNSGEIDKRQPIIVQSRRAEMRLFEEICSHNNLLFAFDKVEANAGGPGVDNVTIEEFSIGIDKRLSSVKKDLLAGTYNPDALLKVAIPKDNNKIRWLSIPTVRDRIVQTSASMILSPILDKEFEECSFAYRKDKSVRKAIHKIIDYRDKGYMWVVDADIASFFDEIDHYTMMEELRKYIEDERVLDLIYKWLTVDVVYKGDKLRLTKGVPQGSPISPLLSNLYLDTFDEALMKGKFKHVRFADDFVILCKDRPDAENALELTEDVLRKLKLRLNMEKTRVIHFNHGFKYLGMEFLRSMVYRPLYEEKSGIELTDDKYEDSIDDNKPAEKAISMMPDTLMAEAFRKALRESEKDDVDVDELFHEKPEIEPTVSGNPLLRTLYLLEQGTVLAKEDERFKVVRDKKSIREIPAIKVDQIIIFGNIQITTQAMRFCLQEDIPIILLSSRGRYFGAVESFMKTNIALHKKQFEMADERRFAIEIGKAIVKAKINNSKVLIQRYCRKRQQVTMDREIQNMNIMIKKLPHVERHDELMGIEGAAAANYFLSLRRLIGDNWGFRKRQKRPPPDPVNSLLSYGYTLLFYNVFALIRAYGLHPYVGFLHSVKHGHPSLVSDIMEEFRAPIVDAVVLNLILRGSLKREDFMLPDEEGLPCLLKDRAVRIFIRAFEVQLHMLLQDARSTTGAALTYRCRHCEKQSRAICRIMNQ